MIQSQETKDISEILKRRRNIIAVKNGFLQLLLRLIFIITVTYLIFTQVFLITIVKGNGMFPALKDGDLAIVFRLHQKYSKQDVVSYKVNDNRYMGRIIAREGDIVKMDDGGTLFVNGTPQSGEILYPTYAKDGISYPYTILEDSVFIFGDYRTQTEDSRDFGSMSMDDVEGKVITILRRRGL